MHIEIWLKIQWSPDMSGGHCIYYSISVIVCDRMDCGVHFMVNPVGRMFPSVQADRDSTPRWLRCMTRWTRAENASQSRTTAMSPCGYWQWHGDRRSRYQHSYAGREQQPTKHSLCFPSITNVQWLHCACLLSGACRFCNWSVKRRVG